MIATSITHFFQIGFIQMTGDLLTAQWGKADEAPGQLVQSLRRVAADQA